MINNSVTIFTGNQPRHLSLIRALSLLYSQVNVVIETVTVFPGEIKDYYEKSEVMKSYFKNVRKAEKEIFGSIAPLSENNIKILIIKYNDLNYLSPSELSFIKESDEYIVFGSSFIKGWLIDFLIDRKAINLHIGISPYYRGSSCNFWAMFDENFHLVGATIHMLSKGLDSGSILFHAVPYLTNDPFNFGMRSVSAAISGIVHHLENNNLKKIPAFIQDKSKQVRFSKDADFNDIVASHFLNKLPQLDAINFMIEEKRKAINYINPFFEKHNI